MVAYVIVACIVIPLLLLIVDVFSPKQGTARTTPPAPSPQGQIRPHVTSATVDRRGAHRGETAASDTPRAPRIAPGDGMVYRPDRGSTRPR